jgi:hypothetical protein
LRESCDAKHKSDLAQKSDQASLIAHRAGMETAPIVVHYNFRRCLRTCRDVSRGGLELGALHRQSFAGFCGVILFAFDVRKKLQRKDFSGFSLPATLCLRVNRSPRQVIVFSGFPDSWCGNLRPGFRRRQIIFGANSSDRRQEKQFIRHDFCVLIRVHRSICFDPYVVIFISRSECIDLYVLIWMY